MSKMNRYLWRVIASVVAFLAWILVAMAVSIPSAVTSGQMAGRQFDNTDISYGLARVGMSFFNGLGLVIGAIFLLILLAIWWKPLKGAIAAALAAMAIALVFAPPPASAYYDKSDYTEAYFILPNESAFFIPDVGANRDTQTAFGSVEYLNANKIAAKRFQVPHSKLSGSSFWSDFYVPTGRLIIVDRTPFNREWVAPSSRGTSKKDESFPCQSAEGLDITVGISISAFVTEENAAKFLYWFGVNPPPGDRSQPQVIFTSVFYGKSLAEVMDSVGRGKVQALVCGEIASRPLDKVNADATKIMDAIQQKVFDYLGSRGITLDYIGWADTFTFDGKVQDAINRQFIAGKEKEIAAQLASSTATLQALATAEATRTVANKWNGAMPSSVSLWWLPSGLTEWLNGLMSKPK
jgi:hypothetical protein